MINFKRIQANGLKTIDWYDDKIIDWNSAGTIYNEDGSTKELQKYHFGFNCDASISSSNGQYQFIFKRKGTKGILLKDGEVLREINRSFYQSEQYEFPATFVDYNSRFLFVHCPKAYNRIDFEDVETGEIITESPLRNPKDIFHSRFEVSPNNKYLISKGWVWQPFDNVCVFDINECIKNPVLLDQINIVPSNDLEICTASFIDDNLLLLGAILEENAMESTNMYEPNTLIVYNLGTNKILSSVGLEKEFGNIFVIDKKYCWDLYKYPKIIDYTSGKVIETIENIDSGLQKSSIFGYLEYFPQIAFNKVTKQIAIGYDDEIIILTFEN